jgi:hypothetical protein
MFSFQENWRAKGQYRFYQEVDEEVGGVKEEGRKGQLAQTMYTCK